MARTITKAQIQDALDRNITRTENIGRELGVSARTVARAMVAYGFRDKVDNVYSVDKETEGRIRKMLDEGMPLAWIAEDVGINRATITDHLGGATEAIGEWYKVWPGIRRNPVLYQLHCEFAPKKTRHAA